MDERKKELRWVFGIERQKIWCTAIIEIEIVAWDGMGWTTHAIANARSIDNRLRRMQTKCG